MSKNLIPLRLATEIAISLSLAVVLGLGAKLIQLPYGGSVNLSPLPLLILALRHGVKWGSIAGGLYGLLDLTLNPYIFHPLQVIVDYPLAFALLGLAGWGFRQSGGEQRSSSDWRMRLQIALAIILANSMRFLAHFISGMIFFASYAPEGQAVWLYSLTYNASYIVPETIIEILLIQFIVRFVTRT